jgi:hypothetical protein
MFTTSTVINNTQGFRISLDHRHSKPALAKPIEQSNKMDGMLTGSTPVSAKRMVRTTFERDPLPVADLSDNNRLSRAGDVLLYRSRSRVCELLILGLPYWSSLPRTHTLSAIFSTN